MSRNTMFVTLRWLAAMACLAFTSAAPSRASFAQGQCGPDVPLLYSRPTIYWKVWGERGSVITAWEMYLNGTLVPARYVADDQRLMYTPEQALPAGRYHAACRVMVDFQQVVEKQWDFIVTPGAVSQLPAPTAAQLEGWTKANAYRRLMGLPDFILDARLCATAQRHTEYSKLNGGSHAEIPGKPLFTGVHSWERAKVFGHEGDVSEDMSFGVRSTAAAVSGLIDAPYHRLPFMKPGAGEIGIGVADHIATLNFADGRGEGVVVYPVDGQTDVPCAFRGGESPDPRRIHHLSGAVGYIIAYLYSESRNERIQLVSTSLVTRSGVPVEHVVNWAGNDEGMDNGGVFIIPRQPLVAGNLYTATVIARNAAGQDISRRWSFTTIPPAGGRKIMPAPAPMMRGLVADSKRDVSGPGLSVWLRNGDASGSLRVAVRVRDADGRMLTAAYTNVPAGARRALALVARGAVTAEVLSLDANLNPMGSTITLAVRSPVGPTRAARHRTPRTTSNSQPRAPGAHHQASGRAGAR